MYLDRIGRAFSSRNYRLYFAGQGLSMIGTWMTLIATNWLVLQLTHSAWWLGIVGFASQIPTFCLAPFAGVLVDRWPRHRILIVTQVLAMLQSLALAFLALTGTINVWQIIGLSLFQGLINAVSVPALQAFVKEIVEKQENLGNAIALNASLISSARLIGPAIGGLLIATVGSGMCFLIDGISYIAVLIALLAMKLAPMKVPVETLPQWQRLKAGFSYAFGFPPIRSILLMMALLGFIGLPYVVLAPIFATDVLHGGAETLGFLMAASAVGALMASIYLSSRPSVFGLENVIALAPKIWGIGFIVFSLSHVLGFSLVVMVAIGFGVVLQIAACNTFIQTIVEDDKRGRVMSFFSMAFMGMVPFGSLFSGWLASQIGAPNTLIINGLVCILCSFIFAKYLPVLTSLVRPIYSEIGILPKAHS
ncbi:MAG: MFS transporter [Chroococcidiopsidaceae cyanobacterium CP_BM_RX_35]|nr:MFS transporter [Chroococcidiopsidaceae cyanobacterium CP_BM_RX_35]